MMYINLRGLSSPVFWAVEMFTSGESMKIRGTIEKGAGKGAFFTGLDWVVEQFERELGWKPFPGTLNVRVAQEDLCRLDEFFAKKDLELVPENPEFCSAGLKSVHVNGIPAVVVFPSEEVRIHSNDVIEVIAGCHIKESLHLEDGDEVNISVRLSE